MAVTKILARHGRLESAIQYVLNGDKTQEQILTSFQYCTPGTAYQRMMKTKERYNKTDGVQCYHLIQSFRPGEISPELALEIAETFVQEHIPGYEAVIGVHVDKEHIHAHILFNSVERETGRKYHSNAKSYYTQIRSISDRLCKEHGLSVITQEGGRAMSYAEWLREQKGQPTFRAMLTADLKQAIEDANDYGHFIMLMEHMGYEVKHGSRLSFKVRGQAHWMVPGRKDPLFTEDGIRRAIQGNLEAIEDGLRPVFIPRQPYTPFKKQPKYTGFLALYVHYLYLLGKIEKREYPPKMTSHLKGEIMKFERYKAQFKFLHENGISTPEQLAAHRAACEERLAALTKQRTILNVQKKKRKPLYDALATEAALRPAMEFYEKGLAGMEREAAQYAEAKALLDTCGISREQLAKEKAETYEAVAEVNREIRMVRKEIAMCEEVAGVVPSIDRQIHAASKTEPKKSRTVVLSDR